MNDEDLKDRVLSEGIMDVKVNGCGVVKFGRFCDLLDRVTGVNVGDEDEDHGRCLDVAFFFISEDDFSGHGGGNSWLEFDGEIYSLAGLNFNAFFVNLEVFGAVKFDPIWNGVFAGVGKFKVFGDQVAESCGEFNTGFGNVVGEALEELDAEEG